MGLIWGGLGAEGDSEGDGKGNWGGLGVQWGLGVVLWGG